MGVVFVVFKGNVDDFALFDLPMITPGLPSGRPQGPGHMRDTSCHLWETRQVTSDHRQFQAEATPRLGTIWPVAGRIREDEWINRRCDSL